MKCLTKLIPINCNNLIPAGYIVKYPDDSTTIAHRAYPIDGNRIPLQLLILSDKPAKAGQWCWDNEIISLKLQVSESDTDKELIAVYPAMQDAPIWSIDWRDAVQFVNQKCPDSVEVLTYKVSPDYEAKTHLENKFIKSHGDSGAWVEKPTINENCIKLIWQNPTVQDMIDLKNIIHFEEPQEIAPNTLTEVFVIMPAGSGNLLAWSSKCWLTEKAAQDEIDSIAQGDESYKKKWTIQSLKIQK